MSISRHERGKFISSRMQDFILDALGHEEIDAVEATRIFDLIVNEMETAGTTTSPALVKEPFYLQALEDWKVVLERKRRT